MGDGVQSTDDSERDGTLVEVHENIGKEGVIVELRPEEHDVAAERDMEHLTESEARELHDQLGEFLSDDPLCAECGDERVAPSQSDLSPPVCEACRREISRGNAATETSQEVTDE